MKKTTATASGGTAIGGGGYGIFEATSTWDGFSTNLPLIMIGLYCAVIVLGMVSFSLWKRLNALESGR
jgi:hypothetical protein